MLNEKQKTALLKLGLEIKFDEPLKRYTYFQIGGPADAFCRYQDGYNYGPLRDLLHWCAQENIPVTILGGGSNILISDCGLLGLVLQLRTEHIQIINHGLKEDPVYLQVSGGEQVQKLAEFAEVVGLTGLEPFNGLPGTVGGAVYNNAHYKRHQLFGDLITRVWTIPLPLHNHDQENFYLKKELRFEYDSSIFQHYPHQELIITVEIKLFKGHRPEIKALTARFLVERRQTQPLNVPSSGCIFKNPNAELSAGVLIEQAGLKGFKISGYGAEVSAKHANFIINPHKEATAEQVLILAAHIHAEVLRLTGITLEREIFFIDNGKGRPESR